MTRLLLLALLTLSCGRSVPRYGRVARSAADGGTKITPDAGPKRADAGVVNCSPAEDAFNIAAIRFGDFYRSEPAEVLSISPLNLRFEDAEVFTFGYTDARVFRDVAPGDEVFAEVKVEQPFWTNTKVMLYDFSMNSERGRLIAGGWTFSGSGLNVEEFGYYEDDGCSAAETDFCGKVVTRSLVWSHDGRTERLAPGEEATIAELTVGNGWSFRYDPRPTCTDTPDGLLSGFVMRAHED